MMEEAIRWNYTIVLNTVFLVVAVLLLVRFFRTGCPEMLRMKTPGEEHGHHDHHHDHRENEKASSNTKR